MTSHAPKQVPPTALSWIKGQTRANGLELAWEQAGPSGGEPLVLVMGLSRQLIHWPDSLCEALVARGFRLTRFDNRDIGLSANADRGVRFDVVKDTLRKKVGLAVGANYTLHDMAEDTVQLLTALDLPRAHVAGVSMGGMIAQLIAGKYPQRVLSLCSIMSSTNHPWLPPPAFKILRTMLAPLPAEATREVAVARALQLSELLGSPSFIDSQDVRKAACERAFDRAFRPGGVARQTHAIIATGSIEASLKRIEAPTQVVHGLADSMVKPVGGKRSARLIRHSKLALIAGMGHDLPGALVPRLVGLIADNAARA